MQIKKININKILIFFLFVHLIVWTLIPSISNINLPLDTIEALAWGNDLKLGYDKHPPLSVLFVEAFYQIFGSQDWVYYFLSQIFVVSSFIIIFKFSEDFFQNQIHSLISVLLLEGIYFYNFTSTEFNVNVCQLPFWALTVYYSWQAIKKNNNLSWILLGIFAALGVLSKYLFFYLIIGIKIFFIYIIFKKKRFNFKYLIPEIAFLIILLPHLIWLVDNNYTTLRYALFRSVDDPLSGFGGSEFLNHIIYPLLFLGKQIGILLPFLILFSFMISKFKIKLNYKDKKLLFLISITILPIILMFITSLVTGARIRTMGMTPFYLFMGVFIVYIFQFKINLAKLKIFFTVFLIIFILSPVIYYMTSTIQTGKRTDYPGKQIATKVQTHWENNFSNKIEVVVGYGWIYGWYAQNLSYHLESRPKWKMKLEKKANVGTIWIKRFNEINNCDGILYQIEPFNDVCMVGAK